MRSQLSTDLAPIGDIYEKFSSQDQEHFTKQSYVPNVAAGPGNG